MAITQAQVTLDEAPVIDKRLQCVSRVESGSGNTVLNELFCLIDPDDASSTSIAKVLNSAIAGTEYGLVTRNIPGGVQHIDDNAASITVDAPSNVPVGVRLSDGTNFYDFLTADLDSGAGSQVRVVTGIAAPASGGAIIIPGTTANGLLVDVSRVTGVVHVDDNAASLTVDAPVGTPVFVRLSDGAATLIGQKTMANSLPVVLASDQSIISVDPRRGQTLLFASIDIATSGDQQIVAADATKKIKVVSYTMVAEGTVAVRWRSATNNKSGAIPLVANSGIAISEKAGNWLLETAVNEALNLNLSASIGVRGHLSYFLET
jgi:hypothetical protein